MERIKKYVEKFFKSVKQNTRYQIYVKDIFAVKDAMKDEPYDAIVTLFDFGYAKGYRAAMSEMKKGGVTA